MKKGEEIFTIKRKQGISKHSIRRPAMKRNHVKKTIGFALGLAMMAGGLIGCGQKEAESGAADENVRAR